MVDLVRRRRADRAHRDPAGRAGRRRSSIVIVTIGMFLAINSLAQLAVRERPAGAAELLPAAHVAARRRADLVRHARARRACSAVECVLLYFLLQRTKLGLAFRGVASNPESSRLLGVPVGPDPDGRLGAGRGGRRARRRARDPDDPRARAVVDAGDPRVRVRGRRAGRLRQRARRGRRRADRRCRRRAHDRLRPRVAGHRSRSCRSG